GLQAVSFRCRICRQVFDRIPADAIQIDESRAGYRLYKFPGNQEVIHDLREVRTPVLTLEQLSARAKRGAHTRRHLSVGIQKENCVFCFPTQEPINAINQEVPAQAEEK